MFSILDRYVGKIVIMTIFTVIIILTFITALITFVDQLRYIGRGDVDFTFVLSHVALQIPEMLVLMVPVGVLLGGVVALGNLAKNSELIVMQSIGISRFGIIFIALKTILPFILITFLLGEFVVPYTQSYAESRLSRVSNSNQISITHKGLWIREKNTFISIRFTLSDGSLQEVSAYEFDNINLKKLCKAKKAVYNGNTWDMYDAITYEFKDNEVVTQHHDKLNFDLQLNPSRIQTVGVKGLYLTASGLIDYIGYLENNNQDASKYRLELYNKFVLPFTIVIMLLLAASTVFGAMRSITMGARIVMGIGLGFSFYVANQVGAPFALAYGIPPIISAVTPSLLFLILAVFLLKRKA